MKRIILILVMIMACVILPAGVYADSYKVNDGEVTVAFEDPSWIVFTRDNIKNNKQLEKLGTDYETMLATMEKSDSYLVAVKGGKKERIELQIRAIPNPYINNINTLTDKEMDALLAGVDETYEAGIEEYESSVVEMGECRYIKMTGKYDKEDYDLVQYTTFINGNNYLISAQKVIGLTKDDKAQIDAIVRSAEFKIDPAKSENDVSSYVESRQNVMSGSKKSLPVKLVITALVVAVIILALRFMNRRRRG